MHTRQLLLDKAQWLFGWMSLGELSFLAKIASILEPSSTIFEIGCLCGRSSRVLADNSPKDAKIYCIDPWDYKIYTETTQYFIVNEVTYVDFCINLNDHIESGKVIPIKSKWEDFEPPEKADFIFIDGNHSINAVEHDIKKAMKYIKQGGIIAGHDYTNFGGVNSTVNKLIPKDEIGVEESIWWTRKS
jgi:predicted O-methyltransferase YrrM